jgi:NADH-quinone oxidoreductase subunit H
MGAGNVWNILVHPLAFLLLLITLFAETNRAPFDLSECEQELVGGFHTEYSAMKFALFFLAEYTHMIVGSAFICVLFLGGWHLPFVPGLQPGDTSIGAMIFKFLVLGLKVAFFIFLFMWVRWTIPRFRFDQLMRVAWQCLVPLGLAVVVLAVLLVYFAVPEMGRLGKVFWGLGGNAVILFGFVATTMRIEMHVSGRQPNMPEIPAVDPARPQPRPLGGAPA